MISALAGIRRDPLLSLCVVDKEQLRPPVFPCPAHMTDWHVRERHRIVKRANDGRAVARKLGVKFGRKPALDEHQQAEALKRLSAGESCRAIARTYRVHHSTISRLGA